MFGNIILTFIAPSSPPRSVTAYPVNSTSIRVAFDPPSEIDQNGNITSYLITYSGIQFDMTVRTVTRTVQEAYPAFIRRFYNLTNLQEYVNYTITIVAVNSAGNSPNATAVTRTNIDGR